MRSSHRETALAAALDLLGAEAGGSITLDGVARAAGLTKAGLMYHFPTREALMLAIVDHAARRLEASMLDVLGRPLAEASPHERIRAYATVAAEDTSGRAEHAVAVEACYRPELSGPWTARMAPWFELPADLDPAARARLEIARLAADGLWAAHATGVFPPAPADRDAVLDLIRSLTAEADPP